MTSTVRLEPGTMVRIKDRWESGTQNRSGGMDHWLGKIMTIRKCFGESSYQMEEDAGEHYGEGWLWSPADFDVIDEIHGTCNEQSFTQPTEQDFMTLFGMLRVGVVEC